MHVFCALLFATGLQALLLEEGSTGCDSFSILTLSANVDAPAGGAPRPESGRGAMADLVCLRLQITLYLYDAKMNFRMLTDGFDPRQKGRQGQKLDEGRGAMAVPGQPPSAAFADIVKSKPTCLSADGTPQPAAGRGARRDGGPAHPAAGTGCAVGIQGGLRRRSQGPAAYHLAGRRCVRSCFRFFPRCILALLLWRSCMQQHGDATSRLQPPGCRGSTPRVHERRWFLSHIKSANVSHGTALALHSQRIFRS